MRSVSSLPFVAMASIRSTTTARDLINDPDELKRWLEPQMTVTFYDDPDERAG